MPAGIMMSTPHHAFFLLSGVVVDAVIMCIRAPKKKSKKINILLSHAYNVYKFEEGKEKKIKFLLKRAFFFLFFYISPSKIGDCCAVL